MKKLALALALAFGVTSMVEAAPQAPIHRTAARKAPKRKARKAKARKARHPKARRVARH